VPTIEKWLMNRRRQWRWLRLCYTQVEMAKPALDLTHLTAQEKLQLIDELWASLGPEEFPLTAQQRTELHRRLDHLDEEGPGGMSWDGVRLEMTRPS
jgi:putative addiction module component (TIGR02574 family)